METGKRDHKRIFTIVIVLSIAILLITSSFTIMLIMKKNSQKKNYQNQEQVYQEEVEKLEAKEKEWNTIEKSVNELSDMESSIAKIKAEYFQNIKALEDKIISGKSNKKIAYLTFDDGPYNLTNKYLEVLDHYQVKATFFTIGLGKERCLDKKSISCYPMYQKIVQSGHTIANHTFSHGIWNGLYSSADSFLLQVKKQEDLIKEQAGVVTNIVRFPGGSRTAGSKKDAIIEKLRESHYGWVDWTAQDGDGGNLQSKEQAWTTFKNSIDENIEVVLLHDYNEITLSILPDIIEYLQEKDYILLPLFYESNMVNK